MKIVFNEWVTENREFEVQYISMEFDELNFPVDIIIGADEETLLEIAKNCGVGWNIKKITDPDYECYGGKRLYHLETCKHPYTHEALFARLDPFDVVNCKKQTFV